jgi:hypothetical protein
VHTLQPDLVPFVADAAVSLALARIAGVEAAPAPGRGGESGRLAFHAVQLIRGAVPRAGDTFVVPYDRAQENYRSKDGANHWNRLRLAWEDLLLLACKPETPPTFWQGLAAQRVASPRAPEVVELRDCCRLEELRGRRVPLMTPYTEAFTKPHLPQGPPGLLRRYVLDALDRRGVLERPEAVAVLATALRSKYVAPDERVVVADRLTSGRFFRPELGADAVNRHVVVLLTDGLLAETDPDRRKRWSYLLALCLLRRFAPDAGRDRDARLTLIRATGTPPPPAVADLLARQAEEEDEADRKDTLKLLDAWRAAAAP